LHCALPEIDVTTAVTSCFSGSIDDAVDGDTSGQDILGDIPMPKGVAPLIRQPITHILPKFTEYQEEMGCPPNKPKEQKVLLTCVISGKIHPKFQPNFWIT
jgi:hypothetical protein